MADQAINSVGTMLEELAARFELVLEAATAFGGRIDALRKELFGQFAEVGSQIRFISEQIAENRNGLLATRSDLSAEMIRLGEALGKTRVEFREQIGQLDSSIKQEIAARAAESRDRVVKQTAAAVNSAAEQSEAQASSLTRHIGATSDASTKRLLAELGKTNKTLQTLARKFERFDDRITIETRDQDQRLRKLERKAH
ncbi:MAG TPA: hypothetical protein VEJ86_03895 [Candidatus Binataceae bacterium]|nr:hypothetical protein [Candidatus Binataceae bacterium]